MAQYTTLSSRESYIWVKDESGGTYLCPKGSVKDANHVSSEELKECVDESLIAGEGG